MRRRRGAGADGGLRLPVGALFEFGRGPAKAASCLRQGGGVRNSPVRHVLVVGCCAMSWRLFGSGRPFFDFWILPLATTCRQVRAGSQKKIVNLILHPAEPWFRACSSRQFSF